MRFGFGDWIAESKVEAIAGIGRISALITHCTLHPPMPRHALVALDAPRANINPLILESACVEDSRNTISATRGDPSAGSPRSFTCRPHPDPSTTKGFKRMADHLKQGTTAGPNKPQPRMAEYKKSQARVRDLVEKRRLLERRLVSSSR